MKKVLFLLLLIILSDSPEKINSQPPVYLTFTTHNEDAEPWNMFNYYRTRRNFIVRLADTITAKGAKWDFQSDWKFLQAVINFDTGSVVANTDGKNLIRWLQDKGIDIDPHSHEAHGYNYADVAYLHTVLGITPNKIVGGFLYDTIINGNNWENLEAGIYGRMYPAYFWKPDILWGGGTQSHVDDPQTFGVWKPQSMANYYTHDPSRNLTLVGNGCNNKIYDTTIVSTVAGRIRNLVNAITYHAFPDSGFYTATVHTQIGDLNVAQINKVSQFIDSINAYVDSGKVIWKNIDEIHQIWQTQYESKPFIERCSSLPAAYSFNNVTVCVEGLYSEVTGRSALKDTVKMFLRSTASPFNVVDSSYSVLDSLSHSANFVFFRASSGTYYIIVKHRNSIDTWSKTGGEIFTAGTQMSYDFTNSSSWAYGNNLKMKGSRYCIFSGDIDKNDAVSLNDIVLINNDAVVFKTGYVVTDVNGDLIVNLSDMLLSYNNAAAFVTVISP